MIERSTIFLNEREIYKAVQEYVERHVFNKEWMENVVVADLDREAYNKDNERRWKVELVKEPKLLGQ